MAKRLLSMVLSLALVLSCISGITLFTMADADAPYAWFDTANGECEFDGEITDDIVLTQDWDEAPVEEIGATGEYGICITEDGIFWGGIFGELDLADMACVINYYVDGEAEGVTFTYQVGDANAEVEVAADAGANTIVFVPTADEVAAAVEEGEWFRFIFTCATENVYIQSAKLVDAACTAMDDVDAFHAYMLKNEFNLTVKNAAAATEYQKGYTGDTVCTTCDTVLAAGEDIPATNTSGLPEPYAWFSTTNGVLTTNRVLGAQNGGTTNDGSTEVVQIPNTSEYGIRLNGDWNGFWIGGKFFENVPEDQSVTMVVEYYFDGEASGRHQIFRYQSYSGMAWKDIFTDSDLGGKKHGVLCHTYTAEEREAIVNNEYGGDMRFMILSAMRPGQVYIKSMKLVNTEYVHAISDGGYSVWDAAEQEVCDYYPGITMPANQNLSIRPEGSDFMHFVVAGDVFATDNTVNKPVYVKVYTKEGYENITLTMQNFEARTSGNRWACDNGYTAPSITVTNGVGGVLMPETSFTNSNNGGSFRFWMADFQKIARIELYDVNTFCQNEKASAEDIAAIHAVLNANNMYIEKVGRVEATEDEEGYTGDVKCTLCGEVTAAGVVIPVIDPNAPFATLDTANGALEYTGCEVVVQGGGTTAVSPIGATGEYGIVLPADWAGITMKNLSLLGATGKAALLIEYYIDQNFTEDTQVFRYQINDMQQVDLFTKKSNLVCGESALVYHIFSEEEMAAIGDNNFEVRIMGCAPGANVTYIQSVKLVSADLLNVEADGGYIYTEFEKKPITDLYPDIMAIPSYNMGYADLEQHPDHPDRDWLYRYFTVAGSVLSTNGASRPVYIKLYAAEGYENDVIALGAIERTAGAFGNGESVQMVDGEGGVFVHAATFTNGMNNSGSLRVFWEEAEKIARIEIWDAATYCVREDADAELVALFHQGMKDNLVNVKRLNKKEPTVEEEGYTGDVYCATCDELFALGTAIPKLEESDLPDPYAYFDTKNEFLSMSGLTLADQGVAPVISPIGGSGEYGIKLTGDWAGFRMEGINLPTDKSLVAVIEYYIDADLTNKTQLFRYQSYANMPGDLDPHGNDNHFYDVFNDRDNLVCRKSGLLVVPLTDAAVAGINSGNPFVILGCGPGANIVYIQSVRFIDSKYIVGANDKGYDYMSFQEEPVCEYYPDITNTQVSGMSLTKTEEGTHPDTGEAIRFGYFKVTNALAAEGTQYRPVVIRFTFKEGSEIATFQLSYQTARVSDPADGTEWAHVAVDVVNGVAEVLLDEACFANQLNNLGSFRLPNHPSTHVVDDLLLVEVIGLTDTTALQNLVNGVEAAVNGKTKASADAYRALVAQYAALLDDAWVTEEEVAAAVAAIEAAAAELVDCTHGGETTLVGAADVYKHTTPGYTGDVHCAECNTLLEEGSVIPAHTTEIRNVRPATCSQPGNSGDLWCVDCDQLVRAGDATLQTPHTWGEGVVTKEATPTEKGTITYTCTVCGGTKTTRFDFVAALGDVDHNGKVDSTDARLVLQFAVKKIQPTDLDLEVADVNGDGKVDSTDARLILQYAVKKIDKFPAAK